MNDRTGDAGGKKKDAGPDHQDDAGTHSAPEMPAPAPDGTSPPRKRSRHNQPVEDDVMAKYTAARAFLFAEWVGALMMVASFTLLYWLSFSGAAIGGPGTLALSILLMIFGGVLFWRNRTIYESLEFPFRKKWEIAAMLVAGSAVIFWLMFVVLLVAVWLGYPVLPVD